MTIATIIESKKMELASLDRRVETELAFVAKAATMDAPLAVRFDRVVACSATIRELSEARGKLLAAIEALETAAKLA